MSAASDRFVRSRRPLSRRLDEETVMFDAQAGKYFSLDAIGTRVWEMLEQPASIDELCSRLTAEFDVDARTCATDVLTLIEQLRGAGLVEVSA